MVVCFPGEGCCLGAVAGEAADAVRPMSALREAGSGASQPGDQAGADGVGDRQGRQAGRQGGPGRPGNGHVRSPMCAQPRVVVAGSGPRAPALRRRQ